MPRGGHDVFADQIASRVGPDMQSYIVGEAVQGALQNNAPAIEVRRDCKLRQIRLPHGFQPHGLPNSCGAGINTALAFAVALFAARLQA